ncbi:MAG: hypothetical protein QM664_12065 [Flavihumibacter sp.]
MDIRWINKRDFSFGVTALAIAAYAICAYFSVGYFHADEQFQIIEFAHYKIGGVPASGLAWEFNEAIRSSFQPWIVFLLAKILTITGLYSPFLLSFILRITTGWLAIYAIGRFVKANRRQIADKYQLLFLLLSYFLWFLPFVNVRFSSESLSGIFFLLALALASTTMRGKADWFKLGMLCGLSFICRFQSALLVFGLCMWLILIRRSLFNSLLFWGMGCCLIIVLEVVLDRLFYGVWIFAPWNYFNVNIIKGVSSHFGSMSWYLYMLIVAAYLAVPIGLLVFAGFLSLMLNYPKSNIVWSVLPFLILHLIVPHKEVRFLFPIVNLLPIIIVLGIQGIEKSFAGFQVGRWRKYVLVFSCLLFLVNLLGLMAVLFGSPAYGRIAIVKYLHDNYSDKTCKVYSLDEPDANPYVPLPPLNQSFYMEKNVKPVLLADYNNLESDLKKSKDTVQFLVIRKYELSVRGFAARLHRLGLRPVFQGNPSWIMWLKNRWLLRRRESGYILYKMQPD